MTLSGKGGTTGWEGQVAFSPVNKLGIMANGLYKNSSTSEEDDNYVKHKFWEVGAGYYEPLSDWGVFELYGGYGEGKGTAQDEYLLGGTAFATGKYYRYFVQPGMALKKEHFETGFCFRVSRVEFYEFENNTQNFNVSNTVVEPAVTFRAGGENIKMDTQLGFNIPMHATEFDFPGLTLSFGVSLRLDFTKKDGNTSPSQGNP